MKNLALTVGVLLAGTLAAFADVKIGTVDMMLLVRNHKSYEGNKAYLTETEASCKRKLDAMKTGLQSLQDEGRKLADELRNPMLADASKKSLENRLVDIQNRFIKQQQEMRNEALRAEQEHSGQGHQGYHHEVFREGRLRSHSGRQRGALREENVRRDGRHPQADGGRSCQGAPGGREGEE